MLSIDYLPSWVYYACSVTLVFPLNRKTLPYSTHHYLTYNTSTDTDLLPYTRGIAPVIYTNPAMPVLSNTRNTVSFSKQPSGEPRVSSRPRKLDSALTRAVGSLRFLSKASVKSAKLSTRLLSPPPLLLALLFPLKERIKVAKQYASCRAWLAPCPRKGDLGGEEEVVLRDRWMNESSLGDR